MPACAGISAHACAPRRRPSAVTCARGSSDNAATFAKYLIEIRLGARHRLGRAVGELGLWAAPRMRDALFLAISQSGRSPDILDLAGPRAQAAR